jgi:hypothetical protein
METTDDDEASVVIGDPSPLWKLVTDEGVCRDVLEFHVLTNLNPRSDLKFFFDANSDTRRAIKRAGIKLENEFWPFVFTSLSTIEFAWNNYPFGKENEKYAGEFYDQESFMHSMACSGRLEFVRWAREVKNCDWGEDAMMEVITTDFEMISYCVENGAPLFSGLTACSSERGDLPVLKYLHEHDCPWDEHALFNAETKNRIECLNYLIANNCPGWENYNVQEEDEDEEENDEETMSSDRMEEEEEEEEDVDDFSTSLLHEFDMAIIE